MNKLIAILHQHKSSEQGFSMVVSTGFGLFIMMLGLTMMGRAMKDSSISTSQKTITRSDAAAQTGTTRLLALISKYPQLAGFKDCNHQRSETDNSCPDDSKEISWQNPANIPQLNPTAYTNPGNLLNQIRSGTWQDIDPEDLNKGQFKLASYTPPAPTQPGMGNVKIEGRIGQSATGKQDLQTVSAKSEATLAYAPEQPAQPATISGAAFPGIWLSVAPSSTNQYFIANGLLEDSDLGANNLYADLDRTKARNNSTIAPKTSLRMIGFRANKPRNFTTGTTGQTIADKATSMVQGHSVVLLPGADDLPTITKNIGGVVTDIYQYYAQGITKSWLVNTVNSGGSGSNHAKKVIVYLDGDLDLSGDREIIHNCTNRQDLASVLPVGSCELSNLQIYGYETSTNPTPKICVHGNKRLEAFIIAPDHTVGIKDGGNAGGIHGALWAKAWGDGGSGCDGNSNHLVVEQKDSDWTKFTAYLPQPEMVVAATQTTLATVTRKATMGTSNLTSDGIMAAVTPVNP